LELPGVARTRRLAASLLAAAAVAAATVVAPATAGATTTPVLVNTQNKPPAGYRLPATEVERIAAEPHNIRRAVKAHRGAYPAEYTKGAGQWQVSWFTPRGKEIVQAYVDDATGKVTQAWTGFQVAWSMARGYPGAFGRHANSWFVWVPLCLLFVAPFLPWRKPRRWSLLHLDLAVLIAFSISLAFFNHASLGLSVPLVYPCLLYLLARMLLLATGRGRPRASLQLSVPPRWLAIGIVFLVGFRIGLNVTDSNVIDVGYAGVIGAQKLVHGHNLYGHWPSDNAYGDTYGPVTYGAYVPAYAIFGWSGTWDDLPAAHAAAILFDLLALLGLYFLGRRVRGPTLGTVLAYCWAAFPFTLFALSSNSNDALVAALIVLTLLVITSAPRARHRGRAGGADEVRPAGARPTVPARGRRPAATAEGDHIRIRVQRGRRRSDAAGPAQPQRHRVLGRLDQVPGEPRRTVLGLGPVGRARPRAAHRPGRSRDPRTRGRCVFRGGGARSGRSLPSGRLW